MKMFIETHKGSLAITAIVITLTIIMGFQIHVDIQYESKAGDLQLEKKQFIFSLRSNQDGDQGQDD